MDLKLQAIMKMNRYGSQRIPFVFLIDFEMAQPLVVEVDKAGEQGIWFSFQGFGNGPHRPHADGMRLWKKQPVHFEEYRQAFRAVQQELRLGNSYLVNLTFPTLVETDKSLEEIYHLSSARYRLMLEDQFVLFSPETFVQIRHGSIASFPMKGTIDASLPNARARLLNDYKELAEHTTIVDLIRNDLSQVAKNVTVSQFRYLEEIKTHEKTLIQASSRITGDLPEDYHCHVGTILFSLLPAGSITGAPKKKTVEIIQSVETYKRGFYTGVAGYFDGHNLDSCVMIRFVEKTPQGMVYKSGGGITLFSRPETEYQELIDKVYVPLA